jgi:hypothetical protein
LVCVLVSCGRSGGNTDDALPVGDASSIDAFDDAPSDTALADAAPDTSIDAPPDAPPAPPSYVVVEAMVEVRADIGQRGSAVVHVMNTGGAMLGFSFEVTGEDKSRLEQPLASGGCSFVPPGQECIGDVSFFPLVAGDRTATLTIHPTNGSLSDTTLPVLARTYTLLLVDGYTGSVAGDITSSSPDVNCTHTYCTGHFVGALTLTASPMPGNVFIGWTDPSCGTSPTCVVPQSTTQRELGASFAPVLTGQLTLNMTGAPPGSLVSVMDESGFSQGLLAVCSTSCTVPLPSDFGPTPQIRISVDSPRGTPAITGACAGSDRCSFTAAATASVAVNWTFDSRLPRSFVFDLAGLRSVARGANGDVFVSTLAQGNDQMWTLKLDAMGNVKWAYPTTGQLIAMADGGVAISWPVYGLFVMQRLEVRDADGYLTRLDYNQDVYASPTNNIEVDHFARTLAIGANQVFAMPGTKNAMSGIEAWGPFGSGIHWSATLSGDGARSITSDSAGVFYVATQAAAGSVYATKFAPTGGNLGTIANVAEGVPLVMSVSAGGDIITTTGTAGSPITGGVGAEVVLRRLSPTGQLRFERRVPLLASAPNRAGVVVLPNDDVMWIHGTRGQSGGSSYYGTGIVAERISPNGGVVWTFTQSTSADTGGNIEIFDLNIAGGVPVAAGSYGNISFGARSWVGTFAP